ncbi:hypothetical protein Slin15195_G042220 [Septoria linicola]|uniref:Uncharacterized protein n=1 Tax=Septoria linicola TaxID=215465 RepID=A0A9Q9APT0_9PEZI|nr:hypothetical protein Slin15195_G042220 [Septoria linicola]
MRTHHEFAQARGLARYDGTMVITLSSDVEAALASEPHYERVKSEAPEDLLSDPHTTKHKRKRLAESPSSDAVAPKVKRPSRSQARNLSSSPVTAPSPVIISSSGPAQSSSPVSATPAPPTSLLPSLPLAKQPSRLRINVKPRSVQAITSAPLSSSSSSVHGTTEISQQITVFCLCWGDDWQTVLEDLRSLKVLKALDTMMPLIAGAIFLEVLADDSLQVSLCERAGTLPEDDYQEAFYLLASHDLSRQQQGKRLARPILDKMLRSTDAGQAVLQAYTETVTSKLVDVFTPQVEVLVNVSHALNPRRKSDPSREWKANFVADMFAIATKALYLKLEVTEQADEHQFLWSAYGDPFDKQMHSARGQEKERVALALSAGLRTFTDDQPSPVQVGLVEVLTRSDPRADTTSSQVSPEFSPLSQR